jgi:hypothetical protein
MYNSIHYPRKVTKIVFVPGGRKKVAVRDKIFAERKFNRDTRVSLNLFTKINLMALIFCS